MIARRDGAFTWLDRAQQTAAAPTTAAPTPQPAPEAAAGAETPPSAPATGAGARIAALEAELNALKNQQSNSKATSAARSPSPPADRAHHEHSTRSATEALLSTSYFARHWGSRPLARRAAPHDVFGYDPRFSKRAKLLLDFLHTTYFRTVVDGVHNVPSEGRCLLVANHAGGRVPLDGLMLRTALRHEHPNGRDLRWLSEDVVYHLPFAGTALQRLGAVRACQANATRLLGEDRALAVFPEGAKGLGKPHRKRYRLQRFGRGGFIRLCLRTGTPLVPCAIVGAEDSPWLGRVGLVPAPTKWRMRFGEPLDLSAYDPAHADDQVLVGRLADRVRATVQAMLDDIVRRRRSAFFG